MRILRAVLAVSSLVGGIATLTNIDLYDLRGYSGDDARWHAFWLCVAAALCFLNVAYVMLNNPPDPTRTSLATIFRLWLDAKAVELKKRAGGTDAQSH
jgi:hypothetical protein